MTEDKKAMMDKVAGMFQPDWDNYIVCRVIHCSKGILYFN